MMEGGESKWVRIKGREGLVYSKHKSVSKEIIDSRQREQVHKGREKEYDGRTT